MFKQNSVLALLIDPRCTPERIARLAENLALPETSAAPAAELVMHLLPERLELKKTGDRTLPGSLWVDFLKPAFRRRWRHPHQEMVVQASKIRSCPSPLVIDATAGLGRDGFLLAAAGYQVQMFERNPIVAALLRDGLERVSTDPEAAAISRRIHLTVGDAFASLATLPARPEVIYLDPMFPERMKSAKVKQELQLLQLIADQPEDNEGLLRMALSCKPQKIVVKRPRNGSFLMNLPPSYSLQGKAVRVDVYLPATMPAAISAYPGKE